MRKFLLLLAFSLVFSFTYSQEYTISGKLVDSKAKTPLESATVFTESIKDSTLLTYTISNKDGEFLLKFDTSVPAVNLNISYTGYTPYLKRVELTDAAVSVGEIHLEVRAEALKDVVVTAARAPVTIKKDTLEFNVASFKTKKGANVEDLLKELPGVEVTPEGTITVNGNPVNKVLVNGKPFFGDDPTIATRNLTKEIVDKIQVTSTKTDSQAFTGEKGDDENKTINITIDEEKNKGIFGRIAAGAGTDKRFEYAGLINYFDNDLRLSALAGGNNINSPGFSFGEIQKMFGNARSVRFNDNGSFNFGGRSFGGGEGITNSRTAGLNYADDLGQDHELTSDYFYSAANSYNEQIRNRETILPDTRFFSNSESTNRTNTDGHQANIRYKAELDSTLLVEIRPSLSYNTGISRFENTEETINSSGELSNSSTTFRNTESLRVVFGNDLTLTKKYGSGGGFFRIRANTEHETDRNDALLNTETQIFGDDPESIIRDQFTDGEQSVSSYSFSGRVRLPIKSKTLFLDLDYRQTQNTREDTQTVLDFDEASQDHTLFNFEQSTDFKNTDNSANPEMNIRYNGEKLRLGLGAGMVFRTLKSEEALRDINFSNDFNAVELRSYINYNFNQKLRFYSGYNLSNNAPNVSQLSPFIDVSDPLNIIQGNPELDPSNRHSFYLGLSNYDFQTKSGFYTHANGNFIDDQVVSKTNIDEDFVRNTTFANVNGNYNINASAGFNKTKKIDSLRSLQYNIGFRVNANRNVNFNNEIQYASRTITYGPSIGAGFTWDELFEIRPSYSMGYSRNTFNLSLYEDVSYTEHEFRFRTTTSVPKRVEWSNDLIYNYNPNVAEGFQKSAMFWNSALSYSLFDDQALITFKVYDLLNQNTNAQRTSSEDYIQDIQSTVLRRYFMLSFSYKFNTLGKKGETSDSNFYFH